MKMVQHAQSYDRGIICYSNLIPIAGVYTYFDSNGKIRKKNVFLSDITMKNEAEKENRFFLEGQPEILIKYIIFEILAFLTILTGDFIYLFVLSFLISCRIFDYYETFFKIVRQFKSKDGSKRALSRIHGAEHKAVNAYRQKQEIPSFLDVKNTSRYSTECGTLRFFNRVFHDTFLSLFMIFLYYLTRVFSQETENVFIILISIASIIIIAIMFSLVLKLLEKYGFLKFMEFFVTDEPTAKEINLAIKAIENFEKFENDLKCNRNVGFKIIFINDVEEFKRSHK